jgi:sulfur-oxidizing protein SoxY
MSESMTGEGHGPVLTRRALVSWAATAGVASVALQCPRSARAADEAIELLQRLTGKLPTESNRLHLTMPAVFASGYTVPLTFEAESPMTETDYVRYVRVIAPRNPITEVATFRFTPESGRARFSTRIRLAEPQFVFAVAEMSDGALLMTKSWVRVESNGCA